MAIVDMRNHCYSYADMERDLHMLEEEYPKTARVSSIGETVDHRQIYCLHISRQGDGRERKPILLQASMHGREWKNTQLLMKMAERFLQQYQADRLWEGIPYRHLLRHYEVHLLPMVNPDGVQISQFGLGGINDPVLRESLWEQIRHSYKELSQKHRITRRWKGNARGVDLNRNFPEGYCPRRGAGERIDGEKCAYKGKVALPGEAGFSGDRPFSEPETVGLWRYLIDIKPILTLNYHSTGEEIFYQKFFWGLEDISRQSGYPLVKEMGKADGSLGDMLSKAKCYWATLETGIGKAPICHAQLYVQWLRHRNLLPLILAVAPRKYPVDCGLQNEKTVVLPGKNDEYNLR